MSVLEDSGITEVFHYLPLHYLPFVATSCSLKSKGRLLRDGFELSHFRSKSKQLDSARGFGDYIHLTTHPLPNILKAKLSAGFPHVKLCIPSAALTSYEFILCRYNIAMTRYLRKNETGGHSESPENGYYYDEKQIPVAKSEEEKFSMLQHHVPIGTMIEILVENELRLTNECSIICFSEQDRFISEGVLRESNCVWSINLERNDYYKPDLRHVESVSSFIKQAMNDPDWKGNGLEYDRL